MVQRNFFTTRLFFFLGAIIIVLGGALFWWLDAGAPVDPTDKTPQLFVIRRGEGVKSIASRLAADHLIRSSTGFFVLVKSMGIDNELQAGDFRLNRTMSTKDVALELTHGILDQWVTTLEGWRSEEIAQKLNKDLDIPEAEFLKYNEEGYMFPDTYLLPRDASAAGVAKIFRDTFDKKVTEQMKLDAQKAGRTLNKVIILASIVEREGNTTSDRPVIAGILEKRLKAGWPLQTDATLQYALGYQPVEKTWWKKNLTNDDKKIKSPFNTYLHPGLPPGPISNPGLASIKAVIYPTETDYWYYLHDKSGEVHYATTIEEHDANIAKYLQ